MQNVRLSLSILTLTISFLLSCNSDSLNPVRTSSKKIIKNISIGSCKKFIKTDTPNNQDCFELSYDKIDKTLLVKHFNAAFNCCTESVNAEFDIKDLTITVFEKGLKGDCLCSCLFDIEYKLNNIDPNNYKIEFKEPLINEETDEKAVIQVNPDSLQNSRFCFSRSFYPWGE